MNGSQKSSARRQAIREHRPDTSAMWFKELKCNGTFPACGIAAVFWILATLILMLRQDVLPYRPGQTVRYDVISRVDFAFADSGVKADRQAEVRSHYPHVYQSTADKTKGDVWKALQDTLLAFPGRLGQLTFDQLPADLKSQVDSSAFMAFQQCQSTSLKTEYEKHVAKFINEIREKNWVILPAAQRAEEKSAGRSEIILMPGDVKVELDATLSSPADGDLRARIGTLVRDNFPLIQQPNIEAMTIAAVQPTFVLDEDQSSLAAATAADRVPESEWTILYRKNQPIVHKGPIEQRDWKVLQAENRAYVATLDGESGWKAKGGIALITFLMTIALACYTAAYQPRVVHNHLRAIAIGSLLLSMLLLAQLAGVGTGPVYLFAVAPTLLVGMILSIAYDNRFAVGIASVHAILVTVGLDQRIGFLLIIWVGLVFACFMLTDLRTRSRLVEIGGVAGIAMMVATFAWGLISLDTWWYTFLNSAYAFFAGVSCGFVLLGILPFIEKAFRITTSMTLLELADASHPLLRRLALEAPGTYSHSLQVATLAEAAAEAIGANSLLCRVAAYYHDVGKINKPDYFVENQQQGTQNRHINLTPSVSFLIIKGHVMDGMEMAREYTLPTRLMPFIQQHHGTTLVEYFFHAAKLQKEKNNDGQEVSELDFRYPGPKPRSKEVAILMLADCAESATRSMTEPTANAIEALVHKLTKARLEDGQFDDSELTLRDLNRIEQSLIKTLLSIYHGRLSYPSTAKLTAAPPMKMAMVDDPRPAAGGTA
jgi:putative nucleotidyltransferase with HDIG domain